MKKFELHLDALITIIVVFSLVVSFILFQRYQYSVLLQENIDLTWDSENLKVDLELTNRSLVRCNEASNSEEAIKSDSEPADPKE